MRRAAHAALSNNWLKASKTRDRTLWTAGLLQEREGQPPESIHVFCADFAEVCTKTDGQARRPTWAGNLALHHQATAAPRCLAHVPRCRLLLWHMGIGTRCRASSRCAASLAASSFWQAAPC